jgi:hypothetical protein
MGPVKYWNVRKESGVRGTLLSLGDPSPPVLFDPYHSSFHIYIVFLVECALGVTTHCHHQSQLEFDTCQVSGWSITPFRESSEIRRPPDPQTQRQGPFFTIHFSWSHMCVIVRHKKSKYIFLKQ